MPYFDTNKIYCYHCKHLFLLVSDEMVDEDLFEQWFRQSMIEHEAFHTEWEKRNEKD